MSAWKKPLRVAAYCRVSTDSDDQANSFESQQRYFRAYIAQQPHWELAGIFADEGLSGTSTKKRLAFQRMIACARAGTLDLIVTKEVSRFTRDLRQGGMIRFEPQGKKISTSGRMSLVN